MISIGEIPISEIFASAQGEGESQGDRVIFIRTGFCNLKCGYCDTKYTWDSDNYDLDKEIKRMTQNDIVAELIRIAPDVKSVVISGGEPMLHQREIITLLVILKHRGYRVGIETNGTIEPKDLFLNMIDQINCSPKTKNSGIRNTLEIREQPHILKKYVACEKTNFKFVVSDEKDIAEIEDFISRYKISKERVRLMPQAQTREEYFAIDENGISFDTRVQMMANRAGFKFTSRLQVYYWGNKKGH